MVHTLNVRLGDLAGVILGVLSFVEMVLLDNLGFCQVKTKAKLGLVANVLSLSFLNLHCAKLQRWNGAK